MKKLVKTILGIDFDFSKIKYSGLIHNDEYIPVAQFNIYTRARKEKFNLSIEFNIIQEPFDCDLYNSNPSIDPETTTHYSISLGNITSINMDEDIDVIDGFNEFELDAISNHCKKNFAPEDRAYYQLIEEFI